ncbi:unnamed protein product [Closterium sp. NIES-53]
MQVGNVKYHCDRSGMDLVDFFLSLPNTLEGEAKTLYRMRMEELLWRAWRYGEDPTEAFLERLQRKFPGNTAEQIKEFQEFRRGRAESLLTYYSRLINLAEDVRCSDGSLLISKFLEGLDEALGGGLRMRVYELGVEASLEEVFDFAERVELAQRNYEAYLPKPVERSRRPTRQSDWQQPIHLVELFGGIGAGLSAVVRSGIAVRKWTYVEKELMVRKMAEHHAWKLQAEFPELLSRRVIQEPMGGTIHDVLEIGETEVASGGQVDLLVAGWECQGVSWAGKGKGGGDSRTRLMEDLFCVMEWLQERQGRVAYLLENLDLEGYSREPIQLVRERIRGQLGGGVSCDATRAGWDEPTALERELAMGYGEDATAAPRASEADRRRALGNAMDGHVLRWLIQRMWQETVVSWGHEEEKGGVEAVPHGAWSCQKKEEEKWEVGEAMSEEGKEAMQQLLARHRKCFALTMQELGRCKVKEMELKLRSTEPVFHRRRKMPHRDEEICEKIKELLEVGLIRRSESEYATPTVVAAKRDLRGEVLSRRMCGDYRALNKITIADRYPMPMAEEIFDKLAEGVFFTTLDLREGFNQIKIREEDIKKTAFHGPDGVLREVECAACYIDDVVIFSTTEQQHLQDVERTLAAIETEGLTYHLKKCRWGEQTVQYLGYEVKGGQIRIQQAKLEVLDRLREPKDKSGLRAVLGFLSYYRRFVPNFSKRVAVLNGLLREDKAWEWGEAQKGALQDLMTAVKTAMVLKLPTADHPFTLYTDWSSQGMGGILCQEVEGEEKVVAYASRICNSAEAQYSSYIGEGLAEVWAVGHFRVYLQGREFTLVTDHQPLTWLMTTPGLTGRNAWWAMKLQEYDFKIKHRPAHGRQVELSGAKGQKGPADIWEDGPAMRWVKEETGEDEELTARVRARRLHYMWYQQQLQVQIEDGWKLVSVPNEREAVIKEVHTKLGHFGHKRTVQLLKTGWWWEGMQRQVKGWVEGCEACQRSRENLTQAKAELQSLPIRGLGFRWSLDMAGELPLSRGGKQYIVLMVEHVSKWLEVRAIPSKSSRHVAAAFKEQVISRFGACAEVLTDHGTKFQGEFKKLLEETGITHRRTSRYHPQSDGLTEHLVQTLKWGLRAYGEKRKRDWDEELHWIAAGYRFGK